MLGIIVELLVSWGLLWLIERKHLSALGLIPNKQRIFQFLLLFFVAGLCCASGFFLRMYHGERWTINPAISFSGVVDAFWWNLKSVLYEELIYRGAILYILLKRLGAGWGIALSSIA